MINELPALLVAMTLPWLLGYLAARWLFGKTQHFLLTLGQGYLLGSLAIVWLTKAWHALGWPLRFWEMSGALLAGCLILGLGSRRSRRNHVDVIATYSGVTESTSLWIRVVQLLFLSLIVMHYWGALQEVLLRPTFSWDAWRGWEPKVIQFFENRALDAPIRTISNYGEVSTHVLLWMMLGSNTSHEPFLHLPWWLTYLAFGAVVYGFLRQRYTQLTALIGAYLAISLPFLNIHAALAGNANIWLTLAFSIGILALSDFQRQKRYQELGLALLMVLACLQTKRSGLGFAAVLFAMTIAVSALRRSSWVILSFVVLGGFGLGTLLLSLFGYISVDLPLPGGRALLLNAESFQISGLVSFRLNPAWYPMAFYEALMQFSHWHLAAYLWICGIIATVAGREWNALGDVENLGTLGGLGIIATYFVVAYPDTALDHTGLSRALLPIIPLAMIWLIHLYKRTGNKE